MLNIVNDNVKCYLSVFLAKPKKKTIEAEKKYVFADRTSSSVSKATRKVYVSGKIQTTIIYLRHCLFI